MDKVTLVIIGFLPLSKWETRCLTRCRVVIKFTVELEAAMDNCTSIVLLEPDVVLEEIAGYPDSSTARV